eukprot:675204-Hanusia_phi.AAC.16
MPGPGATYGRSLRSRRPGGDSAGPPRPGRVRVALRHGGDCHQDKVVDGSISDGDGAVPQQAASATEPIRPQPPKHSAESQAQPRQPGSDGNSEARAARSE